ncbi:aspartic proteinase nepenthesin-2-like [Silene latifolia]|uniref:aspartic proteinase nepenthesin-2-like n=1 Tax=Silene latifolia TaxID=37657 RepID=UPI003D787AFD
MIIHHSQHPKLKHFYETKEESHGRGPVNAIRRSYITSIDIGHQQLFLVFDTGSHFTWVQWKSCLQCLANQPPIIAPYQVTRDFVMEHCNHTIGDDCKYSKDTPHSTCVKSNRCTYTVKYKDLSGSSGFVSTEIINLFTDKAVSQRMVFGLGFQNTCTPELSCFQGVAGFGAGPLALPSQLTPKPTRWGFCLPYNESMDGTFMVGDEAQIFGDYRTAPLINVDYYYLTKLVAIYVIGPGKVTTPDVTSTILIDTGATLSYLEDQLFDNLLSMVKDFVKETFNDIPTQFLSESNFELCYRQPYQVEIIIVLGEAYLRIADPQKVWWKYAGYYCLSFKRNGRPPHNTLGSYHIRGHKVVYDLNPDNPSIQVSTGQDETGCFTPAGA